MTDRVRIGIMGSGFIARTHARSLTHGCRGARLTAVAGGSRAETLARDFEVPSLPDIATLAASREVDAVIVATPHSCHRDHALLCARHGKHVLLEKPMATSVTQCREIIDACTFAGLNLMVAFTQRFRTSNRTAHEVISAGTIGRILMIQEQALLPDGLRAYPSWQQHPDNLGILFGYGIHNIDKLRWLLHDEPACVTAQSIRSAGGIETTTMATLRWHGGAVTNLWSSVDLPAPGFESTAYRSLIVGETGLLDVDGYGAVRLARRGEEWKTLFVQPAIDWHGKGMFSEARMGSFNAQDQAFIDAVLNGTPPAITGFDGLQAVAIALAAYRSAETQQTVHLTTPAG